MRYSKRKNRKTKINKRNLKIAYAGVGVAVLLTTVSVGTITIVDYMIDTFIAKKSDEVQISNTSKENNTNNQSDKNTIKEESKTEDKKESNGIKEETNYLKLVNKTNILDKDYMPDDLEIPKIRFKKSSPNKSVRTDVARALEKMFNDACEDKVYLIGVSGYRSYNYQAGLYNKSVSKGETNYVAKPGSSEHQTGLAMDVLSNEYSSLDDGFEDTLAFEWLEKNMDKYGFILRYEKGTKSITGYNYEPWHLRYVGVEAAKQIKQQGVTLEEYLKED